MRHLLFTMLVAAGCAASPPDSTGGGPTVFPSEQIFAAVYTGGGATGKVTISAMDATGMSWSSADGSVASVAGNDTLATVTGLKAGSTTITATAGGQTISIPLQVISYTAAQLAAGQSAFTSNNCASCHTGSELDVSPSDIGKHTDAQILAAAAHGQNPEGGDISIGAAMHSFPLSGDAQIGIAAYLRSLTPGVPVDDN